MISIFFKKKLVKEIEKRQRLSYTCRKMQEDKQKKLGKKYWYCRRGLGGLGTHNRLHFRLRFPSFTAMSTEKKNTDKTKIKAKLKHKETILSKNRCTLKQGGVVMESILRMF